MNDLTKRQRSADPGPTPAVRERWFALLGLLDPRPGECILDVGFGRGEALRWIAARLGPTGRAVGIELRQELVDALGAVCEAAGEQPIEAQRGSATALPFPDGSFDAVLSVNVLEALPDPSQALLEMRRVLRPGARILVAHADYESQVYACSDRDLARRINLAFAETCMPGYAAADGQLGRHLWGLFTAAGFGQAELRVLPLVETEYAEPHLGWRIAQFGPRWIAEHGLSQQEVDRWRADLQERSVRSAYVYCQNLYVCTGPVG